MTGWEYESVDRLDFDDSCNRPDYHAVVSIQICELANAGFFDLHRSDWDFGPKFSEEQHKQLCDKITQHYWWREIGLVPPGIWKVEFLRFMNEIMPKYMPWHQMINDAGFELGVIREYTSGLASELGNTHETGNKNELENGNINEKENTKRDTDEYYKSRNVFSDFPQTSLQGRNQDYASSGNDTEYERLVDETVNRTNNKTSANELTGTHLTDIDKKNLLKKLGAKKIVKDPLEVLELLKQWDDVDRSIIREIEPLFSCLLTANVNAW